MNTKVNKVTELKGGNSVTGEQLTVEDVGAVAAQGDFESYAGAGTENVDKESQAIPFLVILQPQSPQIIGDKPVEGAAPGLICNSVTNELYGEHCFIIPCHFKRVFMRWAPRGSQGGSFRGEFTVDAAVKMRAEGQVKELDNRLYFPSEDGSINEKKCDRLVDTRVHYVLVMHTMQDDFGVPMVLSLSSTGLKVSKNFTARIKGIMLKKRDGTPFNPPAFSHMYRMDSKKNTNNDGSWWLPDMTVVKQLVPNSYLFNSATEFYKAINAGTVDVAHDSMQDEGGATRGDTPQGF